MTFTSKGIHEVTMKFNADFWKTVVTKFNKFYSKQIDSSILLEALKSRKTVIRWECRIRILNCSNLKMFNMSAQ